MPMHFPRMVWAETLKVFTRGSGIAACVMALAVGVLTVGAIWGLQHSGMTLNGADAAEFVKVSGVQVSGWALTFRNFFLVLPLFLLLSSASSVAGEHRDRTLRELVVRPVSRWSVLAAKMAALSFLSVATLVLTLVPSLALGLALFGLPTGDAAPTDALGPGALLAGYAASFLSDLLYIALGMLASLVVGSVGGVLVSVVLLLAADAGLRAVLFFAATLGVGVAKTLAPWMLGNALEAWQGWEGSWDPAQLVALIALTIGSTALSIARFHRMDVP